VNCRYGTTLVVSPLMDKSELVRSLSRIEFWRDVFAVLVAIGIVGEVWFGLKYTSRSKSLQKVQDEDARKLNLQIETLRNKNLELETKIAPRRLTGSQKETLTKFLLDEPGTVAIVSTIQDPESSDFADDFNSAIRDAHWQTLRIRNHISLEYGVFVGTFEGTPSAASGEVKRFSDALTSIGVPHEDKTIGTKEEKTISPYFQPNVLYLVIGHKPPESAEHAATPANTQ
jgi:hypothetical protein